MGELTPELENLLDSQRVGVLATIAADGKPRQPRRLLLEEGRQESRGSLVAGRATASRPKRILRLEGGDAPSRLS
jgi:hypothetical protein